MDTTRIIRLIREAPIKTVFDNFSFALIDMDGFQYVAGSREPLTACKFTTYDLFPPMPVAEIRAEAEVKNMVETLLLDLQEKNATDQIFAIIMGIDLAFFAFGEGLIVDYEVAIVDGQYVGRTFGLGQIWKLIILVDDDLLPNSYSLAAVDSNMNTL